MIPRVVEVDRRWIGVADADDSVPDQVEQDRSPGIDLRLVVGKREAARPLVVGQLAIAVPHGITARLVEQLAAVGAVAGGESRGLHLVARQPRPVLPPVESGRTVFVLVGRLAGLHVVAKRVAPGVLRPHACNVGIQGGAFVGCPVVVDRTLGGPAIQTVAGSHERIPGILIANAVSPVRPRLFFVRRHHAAIRRAGVDVLKAVVVEVRADHCGRNSRASEDPLIGRNWEGHRPGPIKRRGRHGRAREFRTGRWLRGAIDRRHDDLLAVSEREEFGAVVWVGWSATSGYDRRRPACRFSLPGERNGRRS